MSKEQQQQENEEELKGPKKQAQPFIQVQTFKKDMVRCPSCGKFSKRDTSCHRCGASFKKGDRLSLKAVHLFILFLSLSGIGLMAYGYQVGNHITPLNEVTADMGGEIVQVRGTVIDLRYDSRWERTSFVIKDDTGNMTVFGWSDFTSRIRAENKIPNLGDELIAEGYVNVYESEWSGVQVTLELRDTRTMQLLPVAATPMNLTDISAIDHFGLKVDVEGSVVDRFISYSGTEIRFAILTIEQYGREMDIFISGSQLEFAPEIVIPNVTQYIGVTGVVGEFNNLPQVLPSNTTTNAIRIMDMEET